MFNYTSLAENVEFSWAKLKKSSSSTAAAKYWFIVMAVAVTGFIGFLYEFHRAYSSVPAHSYPYDVKSVYTIDSLTRDVDVIPIHSHNDYWRHEPLFDALRIGAKSVEADIWFFEKSTTFSDDELYVGHNLIYLQNTHTLDSLYLDNLWNLLGEANDNLDDESTTDKTKKFGIFYNEPETSLFLFIDVKTDGMRTLAKLEDYLTRFLENNYLTYFDITKNELVHGPITVITTGNVPLEFYDAKDKFRFTFPDAALKLFTSNNFETPENQELINKYKQYSIVASCSMQEIIKNFNSNKGSLSTKDIKAINQTFINSHSAHLQTRIWGTPNWPKFIRDDIWSNLVKCGIDLLNVDDLKDAKTQF